MKFLPLFLLFSVSVHAQTFNGTGGLIPDDGSVNDFPITVSGLTPATVNGTHGLVSVCLNITHTWDADLDIRLVAPDGTAIMLTSGTGGDGDDYTNTCFDMSASNAVGSGSAPFTGSFLPMNALGNLNNGQNGNGTWKLRITDTWAQDQGNLIDWNITFGANADTPFVVNSSNLPLVFIATNSQVIMNDPRIVCDMGIVDNGIGNRNYITDPRNNYNGKIAIEIRGSSSQGFPKKSYAFETQDPSGNNMNVSLLGMPSENDWILYAPYTDKSLIRDAMAYRMGRDAGDYAPRYVFCELFIDGMYQGVYCLEEKIKRDNNRVDISKLNYQDTLGDELTGGYILKVDRDNGPGSYFTSTYPGTGGALNIVYEDPDGFVMHPLQKTYIENYILDFEDALFGASYQDPLNGFRPYVNTQSFIDFFLVNEIANNIDGYRLSTFLYKDKNSNDSTLHMGPLWDFNLTFGNANYCNGEQTNSWAYENSGFCGNVPLWFDRMLDDTLYTRELKCRYLELRSTVYSNANLLNLVDSFALALDESQQRNYQLWAILGQYVWPNYYIGNTYQEEIDYLKNWITGRMAWLDANMPGVANCSFVSVTENENEVLKIYPNPANGFVEVVLNHSGQGNLYLRDISGKLLLEQKISGSKTRIDLSVFSTGIYFLQYSSGDKFYSQKLIISNQ